jgi:hypothetical protein
MRALLFNLARKTQVSQPAIQLVKQSVRYGGGGPRQFQVQAPKTQGYFFLRKLRLSILGFIAAAVIPMELWNMFLGDSVYCEYDPELYTPKPHEEQIKGIPRLIMKSIMVDRDAGLRMEANNNLRMQQEEIMRQTIMDAWAMQQVENVGNFANYDSAIQDPIRVMSLREYCDNNDIKY